MNTEWRRHYPMREKLKPDDSSKIRHWTGHNVLQRRGSYCEAPANIYFENSKMSYLLKEILFYLCCKKLPYFSSKRNLRSTVKWTRKYTGFPPFPATTYAESPQLSTSSTRGVHLLPLMNLHRLIIVTWSPWFTVNSYYYTFYSFREM